MIDHIAYPHLIDLIFEHAGYGTVVSLRTTCRAWRDTVDRRLVRHLALVTKDYTPVSKFDTSGELHPLPFDLASRTDLHPFVMCLDIERGCEEWDFRPPSPILPYLHPPTIRNYGGITPFSIGDFPRAKTLVQIAHDRFTHFGSGPSRWALHLCHSVERVVVHFGHPPFGYKNRELFYCLTSLSTEVKEVVLLLDTETLRASKTERPFKDEAAEESLRKAVGRLCGERVKEVLQRVESRPPDFIVVDTAPDFAGWLASEHGVELQDAVLGHVQALGSRWPDDEVRDVAKEGIRFESHGDYRVRVGAAAYALEWDITAPLAWR